MSSKNKKIILICSGGGHLSEMLQLDEIFSEYDYLLVTEKTPFTTFFDGLYNMRFIRPRSNGRKRHLRFFFSIFINFFLSIKILYNHYPRVIISTGSHTAVPMCFLGRLLGIKIVFILSLARVNTSAKTANVIYPIADKFIVQWPNAVLNYKKAIFLGGLY